MDKLKYVKLENPDGTYSDSIPLAVDSDHVDVNGDTLTNELGKKASTVLVNTNTTNLQNQINSLASGSPKGVYETTSALVNANPDTGVYIVTADGHIYSWTKNASSAVDLGVYQATELKENSVIPEKTNFLKKTSENFFKINSISETYFAADFNYETQYTSFSGTNTGIRRVLLFKQYFKTGKYAFKAFNYSGTKPAMYIYDETNYNNSTWGTYITSIAGGVYGVNFTIVNDGYYYIVAYLSAATYNYKGQLVIALADNYNSITSYIPIYYEFESFVSIYDGTDIKKWLNKSYWNGKKCLLYGDSLTAWGTWGTYLAQHFGLEVVNKGMPGTTATYDDDGSTAYKENSGSNDTRLATLPNNNDLIIVMFGTNDYLYNYDYSSVPNTFNTSDNFDNTNFTGAMLKILKYLYSNNPNARIIVMCPPWNHYQTDGLGHTIRDYGDNIKELCRLTTTPCIDLFANINANALNYSNYYNDSGTHFNSDGYMRVAELLKYEIEKLTPIYVD